MTARALRCERKLSDAELDAWAEDFLARHGYAVVSASMGQLIERIIASPDAATSTQIGAALYAIYASRYGDYWPCKVFA